MENKSLKNLRLPVSLIVFILVLDQALKIWVKTHMLIGEQIPIFGNWAFIHFTENNGMAFGWEIGGEIGKLTLSIFRIIAVIGIGWYLTELAKKDAPKGLLISFALIFAGAVGNIIDSAFYGLIFSESYRQVAEFMPAGGGYSSLLHGKVVDMFYFPIIKTTIPAGVQFWTSNAEPMPFTFFRPVFNIADSSIFIGTVSILLFHRKFFKHEDENLELANKEQTETL
ncbi:MAG: lipoprotein signal peptidase [Bacteroidales bacterium]|nr:lipoprotein signal peptidase [Bacteroidales bacterium]